MKLKVCGITSMEQLEGLSEAGIDHAGLIFVPSSSRYVREKLDKIKEDVAKTEISKVGVFVNENMDIILKMVEEYGLNAVQLHGDEDAAFTSRLNQEIPVIKAFRVKDDDNINDLINDYEACCSFYLFDTFAKSSYGGTGKRFDWKKLSEAAIDKNFFLSGGISMKDVNDIREFYHPYFYAVDINSRFEISPGIKDMDAVKTFQKDLNL